MSRNDFDSLFNRLDAITVGFGPMFREFQFETAGYPPHNIVNNADSTFILELAVSGFKKHQLTVEVLGKVLTICGSKDNGFGEDKQDTYQHRGIGNRAFEKKFKLAEYIEIIDVKLADGLLSVTLMRNEPEAPKPTVFAIK